MNDVCWYLLFSDVGEGMLSREQASRRGEKAAAVAAALKEAEAAAELRLSAQLSQRRQELDQERTAALLAQKKVGYYFPA